MSDFTKQRMIHFATADAPFALRSLGSAEIIIPSGLARAYAGVFLRLAFEAQDVLMGGDTHLTKFRFDNTDAIALTHGYKVFKHLGLYNDWPKDFDASDIMGFLSPLQHSVLRLGTYYNDKHAALQRDIAKRTAKCVDLTPVFNQYIETRNYEHILKTYPQALDRLKVRERPLPAGSNETEQKLFLHMRAQSHLKDLLDKHDGKPSTVMEALGYPGVLREESVVIGGMRKQVERNASISSAIEIMLLLMDRAMTPHRPTLTRPSRQP